MGKQVVLDSWLPTLRFPLNSERVKQQASPSSAWDPAEHDEVRKTRQRVKQLANRAQGTAFAMIGLAVILLLASWLLDFNNVLAWLSLASLSLGAVILLPAVIIVMGAAKAEREDL